MIQENHSSDIFLDYMRVVRPGIDDFRNKVNDPASLIAFMASSPALGFLRALTRSGKEGRDLAAHALQVPYAVSTLANNDRASGALDLIRAQPRIRQVMILTASSAVFGLAFKGEAEETLNLISVQSQENQAAILAAPYAVFGLSRFGSPSATLALIQAQSLENQAAILIAPKALSALAYCGKAAEIVEMLQKQPLAQQAAILTPGAYSSLSDNGQGQAIRAIGDSLRASLSSGRLTSVLSP